MFRAGGDGFRAARRGLRAIVMKILVANIGSTSFKFRLFDMAESAAPTGAAVERELASGGADRIGSTGGQFSLRISGEPGPEAGGGVAVGRDFADQGQAIQFILEELARRGAIRHGRDLDAVAFKAVMAGDFAAVARVDEELLRRMEYFAPVAPAHNPPYIAAMRMFAVALPGVPLVAAFEPGFHHTVPDRRRLYAVPPAWAENYGIKRYGFHGASHAYIAAALAKLQPSARRVVSCHLGGSSSLCAIRDGRSVAVSMGLSPQSGLPQQSRAGDFDPFALPLLRQQAGMSAEDALKALGSHSGLAALSGTSGDMRDIERAMAAGDARARTAFDVFVTAIRDYLGAYLVELGGADAIAFTGGIGQKSPAIRAAVCEGLEFLGIVLDAKKNAAAKSNGRIDAGESKTALWVLATNEELIVARQAAALLTKSNQPS